MTPVPDTVRIGTRSSALARWQADHVAGLLRAAHPGLNIEIVVLATRGDQVQDAPLPLIGGKGLFTAELEAALRGGEIDLAVHSLKDLPTDDPDGISIGAIPPRAAVEDVMVSRAGYRLDTLPKSAAVGTSSRRRAGQLLRARRDLQCIDLRGNVDTRIRKALDSAGPYDAVVLARAGLERLDRTYAITQVIPLAVMLPAPGQGALAVQCRDEESALEILRPLDHAATRAAVTAERAFLAGLGGGCSVPVAAYAHFEGNQLMLQGRITALDGSQQVDVSETSAFAGSDELTVAAASRLGEALARSALAQGAAEMLEVER